MDFYQYQDKARTSTFKLMAMLFLGALVITAALSAVLYFVVAGYTGNTNPLDTLIYSVPLSLGGIGGASALKTSQIRSGGGAYVASSLGGRQIDFTTLDGPERQLANIVEEVAIAAGMPVPNVYLLDNEPGINAFAAGWTPDNSVIGVTRGALQHLNRNELQGVIAHEFAHIYNGDTKIKTKLIGLVFGILVLAFVGRLMFRQASFASSSSRNKNDNALFLVLLGIAFIAIGYLGSWFAKLIQAAVSRQREYLADASGVQFTRDPESLGKALAKISALGKHNAIKNAHSTETSHLFFSSAMLGGMATHPPLAQRIKRLVPNWSGDVDELVSDTSKTQTQSDKQPKPETPLFPNILPDMGAIPGDIGGIPTDVAILGGAALTESPQNSSASTSFQPPTFGGPTQAHISEARRLIAEIPQAVTNQLHTSYGAAASVLGLMLSEDQAVAAVQLRDCAAISGLDQEYVAAARTLVASLPEHLWLPSVDIALHSIHQLPIENKQALVRSVHSIEANSDGLTLFQWVLRRVLIRHLVSEQDNGYRKVKHTPLPSLTDEACVVLAVVAGFATSQESELQSVFSQSLQELEIDNRQIPSLDSISYVEIDEALAAMSKLSKQDQTRVLQAASNAVTQDGVVLIQEAQLIRVIADAVGSPVPPLLPSE